MRHGSDEIVHIGSDQNHMGTTFELLISCEEARKSQAQGLLDRCHELIDRIESELSEFLPGSPVHEINRAAEGVDIPLTGECLEILKVSEALAQMTRYAFDPLAKSRIHPGAPKATGARIRWSEERMTFQKTHSEIHLSFGAIGKGYALDRIRAEIERSGFTDYVLSAGGSSIVLSGLQGPGTPWDWGWSWKKDENGRALGIPLKHFSGKAMALGISGTHEKGAHILESFRSASGHSTSGSITPPASAFVSAGTAAASDALSTALFNSGWNAAKRWMEAISPIPAAAVATHNDEIFWNREFERAWGTPA